MPLRRLNELAAADNVARLRRAEEYQRKRLEERLASEAERVRTFAERRASEPRPVALAVTSEPTSPRASARPAPGGRRPPQQKPRGSPPASGRLATAPPGAAESLAALRRAQNDELVRVMKEEEERDAGRSASLQVVQDPTERKRLEKIFATESQDASARIVQLTAQHEAQLAERMEQLGML